MRTVTAQQCLRYCLRSPCLLISLLLGAWGTGCFVRNLLTAYPWLLLWLAAVGFLWVHVMTTVVFRGLISALPKGAEETLLQRTPFECVSRAMAFLVDKANRYSVLAILAYGCEDDHAREIISAMDEELRQKVFLRPALLMLHPRLQTLLLGPMYEVQGPQEVVDPRHLSPKTESCFSAGSSDDSTGPSSSAAGNGSRCSSTQDGSGGLLAVVEEASSHCGSMEDRGVEELVQLVKDVGAGSQSKNHCKPLHRALIRSIQDFSVPFSAGLTVETGKALCQMTAKQASTTITKKAHQTVTSAAEGGGMGLMSGSALGAAIGVVPAIFTFGLSIPIGAAIGGGAGLAVGTTIGGVAGVLSTDDGGGEGETSHMDQKPAQQPATPRPTPVKRAGTWW